MAARIDVVGDVRDLLAQLPDGEHTTLRRRAEMLCKKVEALEETLQKRLTSERLDMYQKLIVSLAPTCADSSMHRSGQSVGRMLDLAGHLATEATRHTESEVRNRIEAQYIV